MNDTALSPYRFFVPSLAGIVPTWAHYRNYITTAIWGLDKLRNRISTIDLVKFDIFSEVMAV